MDALRRARPRALYLALGETDDWAHDGRYDRVLEDLRADRRVSARALDLAAGRPGISQPARSPDHDRSRTGTTAKDWRDHGAKVDGAQDGGSRLPRRRCRGGVSGRISRRCTRNRSRRRWPAGWGSTGAPYGRRLDSRFPGTDFSVLRGLLPVGSGLDPNVNPLPGHQHGADRAA